jgi:hypothetical protein
LGETFSYGLETVVSARDLFDRLAAAKADGSGPEQIAQHPYGHAGYFFRYTQMRSVIILSWRA